MLSARNPGATCISAQKLFAISPAPIRRMIAIAICATASPFRRRLCDATCDANALFQRFPRTDAPRADQRTQSEENSRQRAKSPR